MTHLYNPAEIKAIVPEQARWDREGRDWDTYAAQGGRKAYQYRELLDEAYKHGLVGVTVEETFHDAERQAAGHKATAYFRDGSFFQSHGDANQTNAGPGVRNHYYRMSETRAVVRALGMGLNADANGDVEFEDGGQAAQPRSQSASSGGGGGAPAKPRDNSDLTPPPFNNDAGDGYACEVCGTEIKASANYTAAQLAALGLKRNGGIFCFRHKDVRKDAA